MSKAKRARAPLGANILWAKVRCLVDEVPIAHRVEMMRLLINRLVERTPIVVRLADKELASQAKGPAKKPTASRGA